MFWQLPKISDYFLNATENLRRCSDDFWTLPKLFKALLVAFEHVEDVWQRHEVPFIGIFSGELNWLFVVNVLKNKSPGFVSQAWELVLNAWDRCLWSTGTRLTHNAWEFAGIHNLIIRFCMKTSTVYSECLTNSFANQTNPPFQVQDPLCLLDKGKVSVDHSACRCNDQTTSSTYSTYSLVGDGGTLYSQPFREALPERGALSQWFG